MLKNPEQPNNDNSSESEIFFDSVPVLSEEQDVLSSESLMQKISELEKVLREKFPDYKEFVPHYRLVDKIPNPGEREENVKYFNNDGLLKKIQYIDLKRVSNGEKTITPTPVVVFTKEDLEKGVEDDLLEIIQEGKNEGTLNESERRARITRMAKIACRYGSYSFGRDQIEIVDINNLDFPPEIVKAINEARQKTNHVLTYIHEDIHAYVARKSESEGAFLQLAQEVEQCEAEIDRLQNIYDQKFERLIDEKIQSEEDFYDLPRDEGIRRLEIIQRDVRDTDEELLRLKQEIIRLLDHQANLMEAISPREKAMAIQEGLTFAVENYYAEKFGEKRRESFDSYKKQTNPEDIKRVKNLCEKLISISGIDKTKEIVVGILDSINADGIDPIDVLQKKVDRVK
jgi:hypothetical protein